MTFPSVHRTAAQQERRHPPTLYYTLLYTRRRVLPMSFGILRGCLQRSRLGPEVPQTDKPAVSEG